MASTGYDSAAVGGHKMEEKAYGQYRIVLNDDGSRRVLGRGAAGITYAAVDVNLGIDVALKLLRQDEIGGSGVMDTFRQEVRAAAKVRHANVASVLSVGEQDSEVYYAAELVPARSIDQLLKQTGRGLSVNHAVAIAAQAAAALTAAHKQGAVHRNLKAANLLALEGEAVDHDDHRALAAGNRQLKIIGFGLTPVLRSHADDDPLVTQAFAGFIGTPAYASPEQAAGHAERDPRSDLYSLGVILWQLLTGRLPFSGRVVEVLGKHQFQPAPLGELEAAQVPAPLVKIVAGLLAKEPAQRRPQTALELRTILDDLLNTSLPTRTPGPSGAAGRSSLETVQPVSPAPATGSATADRYVLQRHVASGLLGHLFLATDRRQSDQPVAVELYDADRIGNGAGLVEAVGRALGAGREHLHPALIPPLTERVERDRQWFFYARAWAEGFSLEELLQARQSKMDLAEVLQLLGPLPAALDFVIQKRFPLPTLEIALHKIFVCPAKESAGPLTPEDRQRLLTAPVSGWPKFELKLNPLGLSELVQLSRDMPSAVAPGTGSIAVEQSTAASVIGQFAGVVRELLGVPARIAGSVPSLSRDANAALRRALDPKGGAPQASLVPPVHAGKPIRSSELRNSDSVDSRPPFPDVASFWQALQQTPAGVVSPRSTAPGTLPSIKPIIEGAAPAISRTSDDTASKPDRAARGSQGAAPSGPVPSASAGAAVPPSGDPLNWPIETPGRQREPGQKTESSLPVNFVVRGPKRTSRRPAGPVKWAFLLLGVLGGFILATVLRPTINRAPQPTEPERVTQPDATPGTLLSPQMSQQIDSAFATAKSGQLAEAEQMFRDLSDRHPEWPSMTIEIVRTQFFQRHDSAAHKVLQPASDRGPVAADANMFLALIFMRERNYSDADEYFARAVAADPVRGDLFFFWGECLRREGKPQEAMAKLRSAILRNQFETADSFYRLKYWLATIQAGREDAEHLGAQIDAELAKARPASEAVFAAAARALKANDAKSAADFVRRGKEYVEPPVFAGIMQDSTFQQENWRPELAEFFKSAPSAAAPTPSAAAPTPPASAAPANAPKAMPTP